MKITKVERIQHNNPISVYDVIDAQPNHNFVMVGNSCQLVSHNCCLMDEVNFARAGIKDISISNCVESN